MSHEHFDDDSSRKFILYSFLGIAAVFCVLMFMMNWHGEYQPGRNNEEHQQLAKDAVSGGANAIEAEPSNNANVKNGDEADVLNVALPGGMQVNGFKGGMEDKLVAYLNDSTAKAGKDVWFDFDNLNFKTGSAEITDSSQAQLQNIAAILKAYPKVKVKVGGYTDKTGDSVANLKLSQDRANAVAAALKKLVANPSQIVGAEGYGSQFAKADANAPDEERVKDRRISLSVREK